MNEEKGTIYGHTGDLGDIIAALPSIRSGNSGRLLIGFIPQGQREDMRGERFNSLKPLLTLQPYIGSVEWTETFPKGTKPFYSFRDHYKIHENLAIQQARHIGVEISLEPWLTVPDPIKQEVVIARSPRYHNPQFPWRKVMASFTKKIFVGLRSEHEAFQESFGEIEYYPTKDILELARVICGASIVISNQTCAWWLAAGLGVRCIQETYLLDMNSCVERHGLTYTRNASEINSLIDSL